MLIKQLNIINFSGTHGRIIDFDDGFNIVEGRNESGKTTICSFIKFMFYGFSDKAERSRLFSWGSKTAGGTMTVKSDDGLFRIEREYTEGGGEKVSIVDLATGTTVKDAASPAEMFLGVPLKVFTATTFVGQAGADNGADSKLGSAIENIVFSADESVNTAKALKKLDDERARLYYKNRKGGLIYDMLGERDAIRVRLERAKTTNAALIEKEGTLREYKIRYEENQRHLDGVSEQIEYYEAAKKYRAAVGYREFSEKTCEAKKELDEISRRETETGFCADYNYIAELERLDKETDALEMEALKLREKLDAHNKKSNELAPLDSFIANVSALGGDDAVQRMLISVDRKRSASVIIGAVMGFLAIISGALTFASFFTHKLDSLLALLAMGREKFGILCGAVCFVCLAVTVFMLILRSRQRIIESELILSLDVDSREDLEGKLASISFNETKISIHRAEGNDLTNRLAELDERIAELKAKTLELASKMGCDNVRDAIAAARYSIDRKTELSAEVEKYSLARDMMGFPVSKEAEDDALEIIAGRPYSEDVFDAAETEKAMRTYDFYMSENESLSLKIADLEKEIAVLRATVEPPTMLADKLICLDRDIEKLSKRHRALCLACERLTQASQDLRSNISPRLSEIASRLMGELTDRRYTGIGVSPEFDMEYTATDGMNHSVDYMSCGTQDVAYVSLRFALAEILYRENKPPMIFDESFSRLDDERLSSMLNLISASTADGSQIILFTSQKRDAEESRKRGVSFKHSLLR